VLICSSPSLGIDVSKDLLDVCLLIDSRSLFASFSNSKEGIKKLLSWTRKHGASASNVVLEATGHYSDLATFCLHEAGLHVHLANPRRIKDYARSLGRRNKTDQVDAQIIAGFGASRSLPAWQPPAQEQQLLRSLVRRLDDVEALCRAEKNRLHAAADQPFVKNSLNRILKALEKECAALEAQIKKLIASTPSLNDDIQRLCQIEGIGLRSARWLCAELPRHLPNARAAAAWLAVTPRIRQSGTSMRSTAPLGHDGNRYLRRVLYMASVVARHHNPRLKTFADRLIQNGKSKLAVLFAVLHKLIKIAFSILKNHSSYDPLHNPLKKVEI
jgi:transposase